MHQRQRFSSSPVTTSGLQSSPSHKYGLLGSGLVGLGYSGLGAGTLGPPPQELPPAIKTQNAVRKMACASDFTFISSFLSAIAPKANTIQHPLSRIIAKNWKILHTYHSFGQIPESCNKPRALRMMATSAAQSAGRGLSPSFDYVIASYSGRVRNSGYSGVSAMRAKISAA
jgi:hypothetical protein